MPTYEYICDACEHEFEKFQSIKADPIKECPECGKKKVRRKISAGAGIVFKGGGFYETDYRSASYNEAKKKDSEGTSTTKADTKSETKSSADSSSTAPSAPAKTESPKPAASQKPSKKSKTD